MADTTQPIALPPPSQPQAAEEGVFAPTNPAHLLAGIGIALAALRSSKA